MSKKNNKLDSKSKQLIIAIFVVLILLTFSAVMLIAAFNYSESNNEVPTTTVPSTNMNLPESTTAPSGGAVTGSNATNATPSQAVSQTQQQQEVISVEGLEEFTKTGDNHISDSPDNEFIKLIVEKRKIDPELLVAIYAVPDLGNNFVLEFDDKRDENGEIIKSPKTLKRIYHINKERNITVATGKPTGNEGVDYGTSLMTYYLVTDVVMPEFPEYFSDIE